MGIHNEPGTDKLPLPKTADLVNEMLTRITDTQDKERAFVPFKNDGSDEVVLLVNNLGSISELEFGGITNEGGRSRHLRRVITDDQRSNGSRRTTSSADGYSRERT